MDEGITQVNKKCGSLDPHFFIEVFLIMQHLLLQAPL